MRYADAGVTRVSIGAQSFDPDELRELGRRHDPADVARLAGAARAAGIRSIAIDVIFGAPGASDDRFARSLAAALAVRPDHVSTYGLTVEPGTPYAARRPADFPDDDAQARLYEHAIATLEGAGYEHYEISNFARSGHRCRHNENYWRNGSYLGLGVGAASYLGGRRFVKTRDLERYIASASRAEVEIAESENLLGAARAGEAAMLALRTAEGVDLRTFKERYGLDFLEQYAPVLRDLRGAGLLAMDDRCVRLTRRGRFVANDVCAAFIA